MEIEYWINHSHSLIHQIFMIVMGILQGTAFLFRVSYHTGIVSPAYFVFDILLDVEPEFFHMALRSRLYVAFFGKASDGVRIGQWDLSKMRMKQIPFCFPSKKEQRKIVEEINNQSFKIHDAIKLQKQQIKKLEEYKSSLIDAAVTGKIKVN